MSSKDQTQCEETSVQNEDKSRREQPITSSDTSTHSKKSLDRLVPQPSSKKILEERELALHKLNNMERKTNSIKSVIKKHSENPDYFMPDIDLDCVQLEFETLLISAIVRDTIIKTDHSSLELLQSGSSLPSTIESSALTTINSEVAITNKLPKNDFPKKLERKDSPPIPTESAKAFWSQVEPYLAHVTKNDLKWLEDIVKSYDSPLCAIPPLGEHYANNWAQKELKIKQPSCSQPPTALSERVSPDVIDLLDKINNIVHDEKSLTSISQQIVMALSENTQKNVKEDLSEHNSEVNPQEIRNVCKEFFTEQDVKKQLYKIGLLGDHVKPELSGTNGNSDDCDEILEELNECNAKLAKLQEINKNHLTELLRKCRKDYCLENVRTKLRNVDKEILKVKRQNNAFSSGHNITYKFLKEKKKMKSLLKQHAEYVTQLNLKTLGDDLSTFVSEDLESSDSQCNTYDEHIKTKSSKHDSDSVILDNVIEISDDQVGLKTISNVII